MTNRRDFVQSALALSGLAATPFAGWLARPLAARADSAAAPERVVIDRALPAAAAFAAAARRRGAAIALFDSDIGSLWMREIEPLWRHGVPLAGLTAPATLFCLETFARDYCMRVAWYARHTQDGATTSLSWLITPHERRRPSLLANAASLPQPLNA